MSVGELQPVVIDFFGTEVRVDVMHVVHVLCALTIGLTIGNFIE